MSTEQKQNLSKTLWAIADQLRGSMDADDFRNYMLGFLFLKHLSSNYIQKAKEVLKDDYETLHKWYKNNTADIKIFEERLSKTTRYLIKPDYLWDNIAELAGKTDSNLISTLEKSFKHIEDSASSKDSKTFQGLFSDIRLQSEKLGKTESDKNKKLCDIISKINEGLEESSSEEDNLGDAYEYLIQQFASGSGKKAGEFYTPKTISSILAKIVVLDCQDPSKDKKPSLAKVLDFACGSGSLLLQIAKEMQQEKKSPTNIGHIYGQEKNITTYNLARMNMLLRDIPSKQFTIFQGDTLSNDWGLFNTPNPANKIKFDAIVANPPFSLRWEAKDNATQDNRFQNYGVVAPKNHADFAFLLHGLHYLNDDGVMAIILPHGILFRGGSEGKIRKKLIKDGNIDTIISLPANLFYSTGIPVVIIVLKKCTRNENILFIDASQNFEKSKNQNTLNDTQVTDILEIYKNRKETTEYFSQDQDDETSNTPQKIKIKSRIVGFEEIKNNAHNLNISRYVDISEEEVIIDQDDNLKDIKQLNQEIARTEQKVNGFLKELDLGELS